MSQERFKSLKETQNEIDADKGGTVNPKELLRLELLTSFEKYTKCMFKAQYHRSFIVAEHHKKMSSALQDVVDGNCKRLIINIAPRYGKTELVIKSFISWCFALNPKCRFLHLSYSDILVNDNSDTIRSIMMEQLYTTLFHNRPSHLIKGRPRGGKPKLEENYMLYQLKVR